MAGQASRENGKKGGRKKGYPALEAERARIMIAERLATEFLPIVNKAIEQAQAGDKDARAWLVDRAYGKAPQAIDLTSKGNEFPQPLLYVLHNNSNTKDSKSQKKN